MKTVIIDDIRWDYDVDNDFCRAQKTTGDVMQEHFTRLQNIIHIALGTEKIQSDFLTVEDCQAFCRQEKFI